MATFSEAEEKAWKEKYEAFQKREYKSKFACFMLSPLLLLSGSLSLFQYLLLFEPLIQARLVRY